MRITVTVDGTAYTDEVEPRLLLVHYLRERLGKVGTVVGCDTSNCGACTVHLDGRSVKSCSVLAVQADGSEVTTVEGLSRDGVLHPVQQAFHDNHALQCGYCTPGQICSTVGMLQEAADGWASRETADLTAPTALTDAEIRERMSGNICRCSAYPQILAAIRDLAGEVA